MEMYSGVLGLISRMLEFFRQKAFVYIEVAFNTDKPYCVTVMNRSGFDILLHKLTVSPDGFPTLGNGWSLTAAGLFNNQRLKPGQRIRLFLSPENIGEGSVRNFTISYSTYLTEKFLVKRYEQSCRHEFDVSKQTIHVVASSTAQIESASRRNT